MPIQDCPTCQIRRVCKICQERGLCTPLKPIDGPAEIKSKAKRAPEQVDKDATSLLVFYASVYWALFGREPAVNWNGSDRESAKAVLKGPPERMLPHAMKLCRRYLVMPDRNISAKGYPFGFFPLQINALEDKVSKQPDHPNGAQCELAVSATRIESARAVVGTQKWQQEMDLAKASAALPPGGFAALKAKIVGDLMNSATLPDDQITVRGKGTAPDGRCMKDGGK